MIRTNQAAFVRLCYLRRIPVHPVHAGYRIVRSFDVEQIIT